MDNINKGFATFAKMLKCDILPVAITGVTKSERKLFKSHMKITIGKPIPYIENVDEMVEVWSKTITELSGGRK
jgi:1-acyl-sn-glycerol-3-phosphate acyltransferase